VDAEILGSGALSVNGFADLSSADDLPDLHSLLTTLGCVRDAVVAAGPSNRTAGIHAN
jgi:hypothetical protein